MNTATPNDPELDALLGAYALDALDDDERLRVEAYLAQNPSAHAEVVELRESAAALALAPVDDVTAPPGLWDRISATIDGEEAREHDLAVANDDLAARRASRSPRRMRWMTLVAAAAIVVAAALVAQVVSVHNRTKPGTGEQEAAAAFNRAVHVSGARAASLTPPHGATVAEVVVLPDGSGYLKSDGLAQLDAQHTYQLWAVTGTAADPIVISAGVLGTHPQAAAFRITSTVQGFAITIERAPGVAQSSQSAYASATLS